MLPSRLDASGGVAGSNVTIERRGRKGRKERQYFLAAFAAFAFQGGIRW